MGATTAAGGRAGADGGSEAEGFLSLRSIVSPVPAALSARRLSEHLFKRQFGLAAALADPVCARLMAAGCGKGAAPFLSLVPMARVFLLKDAVFVTAARRYNGLLPMESLGGTFRFKYMIASLPPLWESGPPALGGGEL